MSSLRRGTVLLAVASSCSLGPTGPRPLPAGGRHVLFVGNSLTYVNDLPGTVAAIAASAGDTVRVMTAAGPNLALIDHLNGATQVRAAIKLGGWDYVVLQQGPTTVGICRDSLVLWTKMFDTLIKASGGGKTALFMTWPASSAAGSAFNAVKISYEDASIAVGGTFLPAGEAWRAAWEVNPSLELYGPDGFHPSALGTYLAALEIYERVSGRDVRLLPRQVVVGGLQVTVPDSIVTQLQNAAHTANERNPTPVVYREMSPPSNGPAVGSC